MVNFRFFNVENNNYIWNSLSLFAIKTPNNSLNTYCQKTVQVHKKYVHDYKVKTEEHR